MFQVLFSIQIVGLVILLIEIMYMVSHINSKNQAMMFLFVFETFVDCIGYVLEVSSTTVETAFMGTKITYFGRAYLLVTIFMYVMNFCRIKVPVPLKYVLIGFQTLIVVLVNFAEYTPLYYTSVEFSNDGLYTHLVFGKGPIYPIYQVIMVLYFVAMFAALIRNLFKKIGKTERANTITLICMLGVAALSLILYFAGLTGGYDTLGIGQVIAAVILLFSLFRNDIFHELDIAKSIIVENMEAGIIVVDSDNVVMYRNVTASRLLPELSSTDYQNTLDKLDACFEKHENLFYENYVYMIRREETNANGRRGRIYILPNITESYNYAARLEREVEGKTSEIKQIQHAIIESLANIVESRDGFTGEHIKNTSRYVEVIARAIQRENPSEIKEQYVKAIIEAAPLHDIGKISIPDSILCKPGRLTAEEYDIMKTHSRIGADVISDILKDIGTSKYLETAKDMAMYHHEKWDGSGYPQGLKGRAIPLSARIMAVADVYDALRSKRCYKDAMSKEKSFAIIKEGAGSHFDPEIVRVFEENIAEIEAIE